MGGCGSGEEFLFCFCHARKSSSFFLRSFFAFYLCASAVFLWGNRLVMTARKKEEESQPAFLSLSLSTFPPLLNSELDVKSRELNFPFPPSFFLPRRPLLGSIFPLLTNEREKERGGGGKAKKVVLSFPFSHTLSTHVRKEGERAFFSPFYTLAVPPFPSSNEIFTLAHKVAPFSTLFSWEDFPFQPFPPPSFSIFLAQPEFFSGGKRARCVQ